MNSSSKNNKKSDAGRSPQMEKTTDQRDKISLSLNVFATEGIRLDNMINEREVVLSQLEQEDGETMEDDIKTIINSSNVYPHESSHLLSSKVNLVSISEDKFEYNIMKNEQEEQFKKYISIRDVLIKQVIYFN